MSFDSLRESLRDVAFTLMTPFDEATGEILHDELAQNVRTLQSTGAELFIPCGNTGEYYSLSAEEQIDVVETVAREVGDDGTVLAGAGGSTKTAIDQIDRYESAGADAIMVMSLSHTFIHQEGAVDYYHRLAESTDMALVPYKRGPALSDDALIELSMVENVVGVKYAVNDVAGFSRVVSESPGDVEWINGIAERFAPSFALEGAVGFTTGIGNALPETTLALFDALEDEDWERARALRDVIRPLEEMRTETGPNNELDAASNVPTVKHCMDLAGMYGGPAREPILDLSEADEERAETYFETAKQVNVESPVAPD